MKRLVWLGLSCAVVGWGLAGALGGCGSDEAAIDGADSGDPGPSGSSGGTSGGTSGSPGGDDSGGGGNDAGDAGSEGGPSSSNPGKITCGATECDGGGGGGGGGGEGAGACCVPFFDAGPSCRAPADDCGRGTIELRCDEKADCRDADQKCCLGIQGARCDEECGNNDNGPQLCKTDAECGDAGPCNLKTCVNRQFRVCGTPMGCQ